ncbi:MAG: exo-alpha-sialidase [Chloroflexi bacterium]|nr:exo-alpha-sialidase [Chloroflexota bacterium]
MIKLTVTRNDELYECFPDIAAAQDGTLVCTYRESLAHGARPFSRVVVRRSADGGLTWQARQVLLAKNWERGEGDLNCPRIAALADGSLLLVIDHLPHGAENHEAPVRILLFRSADSGRTWQGPEDTGITVGIVPSIKQLSNGDLLLGLTREAYCSGSAGPIDEEQLIYRSRDLGRTWEGPAAVPGFRRLELNEGDFAELDDGTLVCYMREDRERLTGWKSLSHDGGRTWSEPFRAAMCACLGRPSVGRLRSG